MVHGPPHVDVAVLEDYLGVAEYKVDCAVDLAVAIELPLRMCVKRVLVSFDAASVEDCEV